MVSWLSSSYYHLIFRVCGRTAVETPSKNRVLGATTEYGRGSMEMGFHRSGGRSGLEWSVRVDLNWSGMVYSACYLYISLDLSSRFRQQGKKKGEDTSPDAWRMQTKVMEKQRRAVLRNARQKGKIRQLLSPSAGHNRGMVSWKGAGG